MTQGTTLQIGTTKGLFLLCPNEAPAENSISWKLSGPHCGGWSINHAHAKNGIMLAGGGGDFHGAGIWRSEDNGATWNLIKLADGQMDEWIRNDPETAKSLGMMPTDPAPFSGRIDAIWSLNSTDDLLYAGAKPATLLQSSDNGKTWQSVESLTEHPSADSWQPGAVGLTLHTIVTTPESEGRIWLGVSAAGVFASEDHGATWERRNRLTNAQNCAEHAHPAGPKNGETGHCVHNMVRAPGARDILYQQNHHGVFRSRDGGRSWDDITAGLPSTFGFPIAVHPKDPDTIWTIPLNGDMAGRFPPEASAAVWRSRNGGESWEACRSGLPQTNCFFTVLRQAMSTDRNAGLYFGTNTGSIFASFDEGDSWSEIARHLPTILCVEAVN